jgi:hypothetical protein
LLKPGHFFVAVLSIIGCLKVFDQVYIVSSGKGGPAYSTETAVLFLYQTFIDLRWGYARPSVSSCSRSSSRSPRAAAALRSRRDRLLMTTDREPPAPRADRPSRTRRGARGRNRAVLDPGPE